VKLILQVKYRDDRRLMALLGRWLAEVVLAAAWDVTMITAVPLGKRRQRERGYNQAGRMAAALAANMNLPFRPMALTRNRETLSQVGLDAVERRANVQGAFTANPDLVKGEHCLIVDDLYTTGATLNACAAAAREAGACDVVAVTVARTSSRV